MAQLRDIVLVEYCSTCMSCMTWRCLLTIIAMSFAKPTLKPGGTDSRHHSSWKQNQTRHHSNWRQNQTRHTPLPNLFFSMQRVRASLYWRAHEMIDTYSSYHRVTFFFTYPAAIFLSRSRSPERCLSPLIRKHRTGT